MAASLTTCGRVLSLFTAFPATSVGPSVPRSRRKVLTVRRHPSALSSAPGAVGEVYVGLGSFPRSDYPGLLGRSRPLALGPSPPPLPSTFLHFSQISSLAAQTSADDVCYAHMCNHTSVVPPNVAAASGKAAFYENKCVIKELGCVGFPDWFSVLASHHLGC